MRCFRSISTVLFIVFPLATALLFAACDHDGASSTTPDGDTDNVAETDSADEAGGELDPGEEAPEEREEAPAPVLWPFPDPGVGAELDATTQLYVKAPWLLARNRWAAAETFVPGEAIRHSSLAYFPIGNGLTFAYLGATEPQHHLHEHYGPTYQTTNAGFFPDLGLRVFNATVSASISMTRQFTWRAAQSGVVCSVTRSDDDALDFHACTFAPRTEAGEPLPVLAQVVMLHNRGAANLTNLGLYAESPSASVAVGDALGFVQDDRSVAFAPLDREGWKQGKRDPMPRAGWYRDGIDLAAGESKTLWWGLSYADGDGATPPALPSESEAWDLLDATDAWWRAWFAAGPTLETPDERVNDLFESLQYTVKTHQSAQGALVPMSHYSNVWIRDTFGPARFFFRIGRYDDALRMIEYYHHVAAARGDVANSLPCDADVNAPVEEPDWLAKPAFTGRTRGEGPSYIPLMYAEYLRAGGDAALVVERLPYLLRTLLGQGVTEEGFMYFSGDETWRPALAVNLCLSASYAFEDLAYSSNTGFLYVAASQFLIDFIDALPATAALPFDRAAMLTTLRRRADVVAANLDTYYWLADEQRYSPYILMDGLVPQTRPSPDVNPIPLWLDLYRDDERQARNLASCYEASGTPEGLIQDYCADGVEISGFDVTAGLYTGMSAGYWLYALKQAGMEDLGEQAFNAFRLLADASGNVPEDGVYGSFEPLQIFYFPKGGTGDLWSRCRPWEGAIMAEALLHYLLGPSSWPVSDVTTFHPALPNNWPGWRLRGLTRSDGRRSDVVVSPGAEGPAAVVEDSPSKAEP